MPGISFLCPFRQERSSHLQWSQPTLSSQNSEWVETIEDGWNVLVGTDKEKIFQAVNSFHPSLKLHKDRFGNGDAAEKIAAIIGGLQ